MTYLIASNIVLWIAVLGLTVVMLGLMRQVGLLHERSSPMGAMITDHGPDIGDKAPEFELPDYFGRSARLGGVAADGRPTLVMMHQPPFESGIGYIDAYNCRGGDRLAAILARHRQVERLVCGHIHRFMQLRFGGTLLVTAPSTTTAIALRLAAGARPASYVEPPALLLHDWREGTGLITHHVPIGTFPGPYPFY